MKNHTNKPVLASIEEILVEASVYKGSPKHTFEQFLVPQFYLDQATQALLTLFNNMCDEVIGEDEDPYLDFKDQFHRKARSPQTYNRNKLKTEQRQRKDNLLKGKL